MSTWRGILKETGIIMRKTLIVGNWKMNKTPSEAKVFAKELERELNGKTFDTDELSQHHLYLFIH